MKKLILPLLLVVSFIFAGFDSAGAAVAISNVTTTPVLPAGNTPTTTNAVVAEFSAAITTTTSYVYACNWTSSGASAPNVTTTSFSLYEITATTASGTPTFSVGAATLLQTITAPNTVGATLAFGDPVNGFGGFVYGGAANRTAWFYLVENFTVPATPPGSEAFTLQKNVTMYTNGGTSITPTYPSASYAGNVYTWTPPTVSATDIATTNLTNTAIYVGQSNIAVAGMSLTATSVANNTTLTQMVFNFTPTSLATANAYFKNTTIRLVTNSLSSPYSNTGAVTVSSGANVNLATGTVTFTVTPAVAINTTTANFYLVVDYIVPGGSTPQPFTFTPYSYKVASSATVSTTGFGANTFTCTTPTYYWTGAAADNNWQNAANWEVTTTAPIIVTSYYPGQIYSVLGYTATTPDNVVISPVKTAPTINLSANLTIGTLTNLPGVNTILNINGSAITLNLATQLYLGSITSGAAASSLTLGGGGILDVNADAELNYSSNLIVPANGNITIDNSVNVNMNGGAGQAAKITLSGGNVLSNGGNFEMNGASALITATSGTFSALNDSYIDLVGANDQIINNGATFNITDSQDFSTNVASANVTNTSGIMNITDSQFLLTPGSFTVTGGTVNITNNANGTSFLSVGGYNLEPITDNFYSGTGTVSVTGGTFNVSGASEVETEYGTGSTFTNNGGSVNFTGNSILFANYGVFTNTSGTFVVNASTVNLAVGAASLVNSGTFNTTNGTIVDWTYKNSILSNTGGSFNATNTTFNFGSVAGSQLGNSAGTFILGKGSVMNLSGQKSAVNNSSTGTFTCAPSSVINLTFSAGTVANAPTVTNTSSNPFTLLSDHTGSATIGTIATAVTTSAYMIGQFNVQRYISTASRNYRLLSSPTNVTQALPGTAGSPNLVDISQLGNSVTNPATYNGAFIGGPGNNFTYTIANPLLYLYQETLLPGTSENSTFTSGKNVGVINISKGSPYLESTMSTAAGGQTPSDNATSTVKIPAGNAYLLYYIHDNTTGNVSATLDTSATTATGYINQGTIPFVLWGTGTLTNLMTRTTTAGVLYPGVTMVGNPYPSSIDLEQVYKDNIVSGSSVFTSGSGEAFYELDPTTEQFVSVNYSYNGTTGTLTTNGNGSRYVASGQGFYITVLNNSRALNFAEDQKIPSATSAAVVGVPTPVLEGVRTGPGNVTDNISHTNTNDAVLSLVNTSKGKKTLSADINPKKKSHPLIPPADGKIITYPKLDSTVTPKADSSKLTSLHLKLVLDSVHYDECGIYFSKKFSDTLERNDAIDLDGTGGKVYLSSYTSNRVRTSINAMSMFDKTGKRIPLYVKFAASGLYSLGLADIANFNKHYSVFLLDKMLNDSLDLTLYKSYNFNYTAGTAGDSTRFVLAIEHKPIPHYALVAFAGSKVTPGVQLDWKTLNEGNITTFVLQKLSANNTYVFLDSLHSDSAGAYSYVDQHPTLGNNTYRLQQTDGLGDITYSAPVTIGYNSTSPNGGLTLYPNPAKTTMTVTLATSSSATTVATADIYNTSGKLIAHKVVNSNSFVHDVSAYDLGIYIIELKNSNGVLVGKSKFVKVN